MLFVLSICYLSYMQASSEAGHGGLLHTNLNLPDPNGDGQSGIQIEHIRF